MKLKKSLFVLSAVALLGLSACGGDEPAPVGPTGPTYERADSEKVYEGVLGNFRALMDADGGLENIVNDSNRYVRYAEAEAELLNSGAFVPTTTQGGRFALTRIAPRTSAYVFFGLDGEKVSKLVMTKGNDASSFIKKADRDALKEIWAQAQAAGDPSIYDASVVKSYLTNHGYQIGTEYAITTSAAAKTMDMLSTYKQADTEAISNCIEGLIQYNNIGQVVPAMAESWDISEDFKTYTFHIRSGAKWFSADGTEITDVKASDFYYGLQHMLDTKCALAYLVDGVIEGVHDYRTGKSEGISGYIADDEAGTLTVKLERSETYFLSRLAYSCFVPICKSYFESKGGAFGLKAYADAAKSADYKYGKVGSVDSVAYNSAMLPKTWDLSDTGGSIVLEKNANYWDAANVQVTKATWNYDKGDNPTALYNAVKAGTYPGCSLLESSGLLKAAKDDGLFDTYAYISDTTATTFLGGINMNRGAFDYEGAVLSSETEEEKILTAKAVKNIHFRKALLYGWDRASWNAVAMGEDAKNYSLRNMYCVPDFVYTSEEVTYKGHTFPANSSYGELVQYFADKLGLGANLADGLDGWYNKDRAQAEIKQAVAEIAGKDGWKAGQKIVIENVTWPGNPNVAAQANSFKQLIEAVLGDYVEVRLIEAADMYEYYYAGYYADVGSEVAQDICYGTGWGPDFADPSTYLNTYHNINGGDMLTICGLSD